MQPVESAVLSEQLATPLNVEVDRQIQSRPQPTPPLLPFSVRLSALLRLLLGCAAEFDLAPVAGDWETDEEGSIDLFLTSSQPQLYSPPLLQLNVEDGAAAADAQARRRRHWWTFVTSRATLLQVRARRGCATWVSTR